MTNQIEPQHLYALMEKDAVKVIDGSWALDGTDMHALYRAEHIPGARFFDIEDIRDRTSALPHMAPSADDFADAVGRMGISPNDHVVVYDRQGLFSAARVWWTFRLMGHTNIQVLRGGLPAWKLLHLPLSDTVSTPVVTRYQPCLNDKITIDLNELRQRIDNSSAVILDARSKPRFEGIASEPRAGLRSGHMPGARSLPFTDLIRDGALKPREELEAVFCSVGLVEGATAITTCGSGVTAAIISMALDEIGHTSVILYDGSWAEWGQASLDTLVIKSMT